MATRVILHSDLNNFYASVECLRRPEIRDKPVVVTGAKEDRHGVVLAKNQIAKAAGVKTGDVYWEARQTEIETASVLFQPNPILIRYTSIRISGVLAKPRKSPSG